MLSDSKRSQIHTQKLPNERVRISLVIFLNSCEIRSALFLSELLSYSSEPFYFGACVALLLNAGTTFRLKEVLFIYTEMRTIRCVCVCVCGPAKRFVNVEIGVRFEKEMHGIAKVSNEHLTAY